MAPKRQAAAAEAAEEVAEEEPSSPKSPRSKKGAKGKKHKAGLAKGLEVPDRKEYPEGKLLFLLKRPGDALRVLEKKPGQSMAVQGLHTEPARKIVASMQEGDEVLLYRYNAKDSEVDVDPALTAVCSVSKAPYQDPTDETDKGFLAFDIKLEEAYEEPISQESVKSLKGKMRGHPFWSANWGVFHVTPSQWESLTSLPAQAPPKAEKASKKKKTM